MEILEARGRNPAASAPLRSFRRDDMSRKFIIDLPQLQKYPDRDSLIVLPSAGLIIAAANRDGRKKKEEKNPRNHTWFLLTRSPHESAASCDAELLSLLLDAGLLVGCVSSPLYAALSAHMLAHQREGGWDVEAAAGGLLAAGRGPEAGSLLLAHRGAHRAQFTFNAALAVVKKWL
ncbi:Neuroblastoma-amplified sequence [Liparis tanakae]|uniref:Neuroblastoma-amplified sequence n=1 Tax=Liparis tanakae TaxID=230148 RepID=A0A4Z2I1E8_9TELE|nr:Neuroblastoma-amplified sequence [Liparis tanakae]